MTSFTRKLHSLDPDAAKAIHRQEYGNYRYGRHVTLAQFAYAPQAPTFGQRQSPPALPAYECWAPELGKPRQIVHGATSFDARKRYASYHQIGIWEVASRRADLPSR